MVGTKLVPALLLAGALAVGFAPTPAQAQINVGSGVVIDNIDLDLDDLELVGGVLQLVDGATATVTGTIAGLPFTTTLTDFALDLQPDTGPGTDTPANACSILHLELGPIDLALLGLFVNTSPICLDITALPNGGLLGELLCGLADLDLGTLLGQADLLAGVGELINGDVLTGSLSEILTTALRERALTGHQQGPGIEDICEGEVEILDLVLGPVTLNLLGLVVELDDCTGGPVQVCVSATAGEGLLGDLLAGLLGGGLLDLGDLEDLLDAIAGGLNLGNIQDLVEAVLGGLNIDATQKEVNKLAKEVSKALRDGQLSNNELSKITRTIAKIVR